MKQISILIILLLLANFSFSQTTEIDSLKQVIENVSIDRSEAYNLLYKKLKRKDIELAKTYLDQAYTEAVKHKNDTSLGAYYNYIGYYYKKKSSLDTALILLKKSLDIRLKISDSIGISKVYNNLGSLYLDKSLYSKAVENLNMALKYKLALGKDKGAGISYNALGNVYNKWEKNEEAIQSFQNALKMFQKANFRIGVASSYNNIGLIYQNLAKEKDTVLLNQADNFFQKALTIDQEINDPWNSADAQSNIANIYSAKADKYSELIRENPKDSVLYSKVIKSYYKQAIIYNEQCAINKEKVGDLRGVAASYIGLGAIYNNQEEFEKSLVKFKKALELAKQTEDPYQLTVTYTYLGMSYTNLRNYQKALYNLQYAEKTALKNDIKRELPIIYRSFSEAYDSLRNYSKALYFNRKYTKIKDEVYSEDNLRIVSELQTKYETNQKEAALEIANQENEKQQLKSKQQMLIIYGFSGVFVIIIIFSFVVYRQFKQIRKANISLSEQKAIIEQANGELYQQNEEISAQRDEIQDQKDHIEEIHREVSDSIHYAERIQKAILPQVEDIKKKISDRFILFKPKDIVSGDFYWMKHLKKSKLFIATAADCTGHGVPGAFMSMLGVAFLNEIVNKSTVLTSGHVLDNLRQSVITSLHQTGKEGEAQDGMDIALVAYNYETKKVQYSGANNPLYIIRPKENKAVEIADKVVEGETHTLYEIKGDKMPIGIYKKELVDFATVEIQLLDGDQIYMFSDGYADQFGGPKGKKLKYKPFKNLLLTNTDKPMDEQAQILNDYFEEWRGELEQIDDVIVIGIKV